MRWAARSATRRGSMSGFISRPSASRFP
jgi:hypothetical protein